MAMRRFMERLRLQAVRARLKRLSLATLRHNSSRPRHFCAPPVSARVWRNAPVAISTGDLHDLAVAAPARARRPPRAARQLARAADAAGARHRLAEQRRRESGGTARRDAPPVPALRQHSRSPVPTGDATSNTAPATRLRLADTFG